MQINKALFSLFLLTNLLFVPSVFAGGGPVEFTVDPNQALNPGEQYIVHTLVYADGPYPTYCKNCFIKLALQNPQEGDYIVQNNDVTNDEGRIYAEVISKVPGNRTLYVQELRSADGTRITANSTVVLNYTGEFTPPSNPTPSPASTPAPNPSDGISVWLLSQQIDGPTSRTIIIKWNAFGGNPGTFTVYGRPASNKNNWDKLLEGQRGPSASVGIRSDEDYYIKVNGCQDKVGNCVDSNVLLLPKTQQQNREVLPSQSPNPTITPSGDNTKVEELNKKVENLQNQLEASKQKQNTLEQRINDLVSFIKRFFSFFR